jgi:hypothetical protein
VIARQQKSKGRVVVFTAKKRRNCHFIGYETNARVIDDAKE